MNKIKSRIKKHVKIKAGDLVPHELNPRLHPEDQRRALQALYDRIGFARSLLAYELSDGRLKLIDGHLRRELDPDMEVEVEVLDVNDDEARALLLSIDPLVQLADYDGQVLDELRRITHTDDAMLQALWSSLAGKEREVCEDLERTVQAHAESVPEQFLVLIECEDEAEQAELLERFVQEGLKCKALLS